MMNTASPRVFGCLPSLYVYAQSLQSCASVCDPWTTFRQAPLSMGFSRKEYWSGLPFPPPGDLPDSGIQPGSLASPALQADSFPLSHQGSPRHPHLLPFTVSCEQQVAS